MLVVHHQSQRNFVNKAFRLVEYLLRPNLQPDWLRSWLPAFKPVNPIYDYN